MNDSGTSSADRRRRIALVAFWVWAAIFVAGALGELFGIGFLREAVDFKRIFLR